MPFGTSKTQAISNLFVLSKINNKNKKVLELFEFISKFKVFISLMKIQGRVKVKLKLSKQLNFL
jgi:hypothetical protein